MLIKARKLAVQLIWICTAMLVSFNASSTLAKEPFLVVLYPDMREPYRAIFDDIIGGIKGQYAGQVISLPLGQTIKAGDIKDWLAANQPGVIISLGNRGRDMASELSRDYRVITGATMLSDDNISAGLGGISLTPAPERLFQQLHKLAPKVRTVRVIYHPDTSSWLINEARQAAERTGLKLLTEPAENVMDAASGYRKILAGSGNGKEALWLLQGDPTLDERGLLPLILSEAWEKNLLVFSSNPSHVQRGALFSLFPNNIGLGRRLAEKARQVAKGKDLGAETMHDLRTAVNVRTAEHLNLNISRADERNFDLVFPQR